MRQDGRDGNKKIIDIFFMTFVRPFNICDVRILSSVVAGNCSLYGDLNELNKTELKVGLTSETIMNDFNSEELKA